MNIRRIVTAIQRRLFGELYAARKQGMCVEPGVTVMKGTSFGSEPYLITLRKHARISSSVLFVTHDGGTYSFKDTDQYKDVVRFGKIEVGERSFIGARCIIMPGVTIGSHSVVGAGSVVTKDIPDRVVACGSPARVICTLDEYAEKCIKRMPEEFDVDEYHSNKKQYLIKIAEKFTQK